MIDEDRTTWTLGQLADEVIEACELPMGCRATIIAALGDAKGQGKAEGERENAALREALERIAEYDDPMDRGDACASIAKRALKGHMECTETKERT